MTTKPQFPSFRLAHKQTRPGTHPGTPGGNRLVCVTDEDILIDQSLTPTIKRVRRDVAVMFINLGWKYTSKSTYKAANRGR